MKMRGAVGGRLLVLGACGAAGTRELAAGDPEGTMPAAAIGRWGLVPADCVSARGDAKGLLTVGETTLRFYESRAVLGRVEERSPTQIVASFPAEGMQWSSRMAFEVRNGGETLIRRDLGAVPEVLTYSACV